MIGLIQIRFLTGGTKRSDNIQSDLFCKKEKQAFFDSIMYDGKVFMFIAYELVKIKEYSYEK